MDGSAVLVLAQLVSLLWVSNGRGVFRILGIGAASGPEDGEGLSRREETAVAPSLPGRLPGQPTSEIQANFRRLRTNDPPQIRPRRPRNELGSGTTARALTSFAERT